MVVVTSSGVFSPLSVVVVDVDVSLSTGLSTSSEVVVVVVDTSSVVVVVVVSSSMMIAPLRSCTCDVISSPLALLMNVGIVSPPHTTGYSPAAQSAGTTYVSVRTVALSAAALPPTGAANAYSNVPELLITVAPYASEPVAPVYTPFWLKGVSELMINCAPPITSAVLFASIHKR